MLAGNRLPLQRYMEESSITSETYGPSGRVSYQIAAFDPRDQGIILSFRYATLGS